MSWAQDLVDLLDFYTVSDRYNTKIHVFSTFTYCFVVYLQAVGCALNVLGFGESIALLLGVGDYPWAVRSIAGAAVMLLSVINMAGVKWVIKLQFALLLILLLSGLDFMVGSFTHIDPGNLFINKIS